MPLRRRRPAAAAVRRDPDPGVDARYLVEVGGAQLGGLGLEGGGKPGPDGQQATFPAAATDGLRGAFVSGWRIQVSMAVTAAAGQHRRRARQSAWALTTGTVRARSLTGILSLLLQERAERRARDHHQLERQRGNREGCRSGTGGSGSWVGHVADNH